MLTEINFEIDIEPVFSNHMYRAVSAKSSKRKSGYWAVIAKTDALKKYQELMKLTLPRVISESDRMAFKYAFDTGVYDIQVESTHYIYYKRFYDMDASNLIKAYEDCIATYLGIDDCYTSKYIVEKIPVEVERNWLIKTTMKLVPKNPLTNKM